jgi:hypothetical protein
MNRIKSLILTLALLSLPSAALAKVPWGAIGAASTGASPVCTTFSTDPVCVVTLSTTTASITISGGSTGGFYTLILMENGTGNFAVSGSLVGGLSAASYYNSGALPASIPTAANNYSVWVVQATNTTTPTYSLVGTYDQLGLNDVFTTTQVESTASIASAVTVLYPTITVPGVTLTSGCLCQPQVNPSLWGSMTTGCIPQTNAVQCTVSNATAASIAPSAVTLNVRLTNP